MVVHRLSEHTVSVFVVVAVTTQLSQTVFALVLNSLVTFAEGTCGEGVTAEEVRGFELVFAWGADDDEVVDDIVTDDLQSTQGSVTVVVLVVRDEGGGTDLLVSLHLVHGSVRVEVSVEIEGITYEKTGRTHLTEVSADDVDTDEDFGPHVDTKVFVHKLVDCQ